MSAARRVIRVGLLALLAGSLSGCIVGAVVGTVVAIISGLGRLSGPPDSPGSVR
jgi:type III secretory pathway component EscS